VSRAKPKKRGKANAKAESRLKLSPATWWRAWATLGWLTTLSLLLVGAHWLDRAVAQERPPVACTIAWADTPPALSALAFDAGDKVLDAIAADIAPAPGADFYSADLVQNVGRRAQANPWIARVRRVSKQSDGRITVDADFRRPLAFVERDGWAYLVDEDGVRLPPDGTPRLVRDQGWLLITGVEAGLPDVGETWPGADVRAGIALVRFLDSAARRNQLPFRPVLRAIDVANYDRGENAWDGMLRLRTAVPKCYINWGAAPGEGEGVEASPTRKLDMLRSYYRESGTLPAGVILDVRFPEGIEPRKHP
jgi:hypothetical protein